jgi:hypothetical protein
LIYDAAKSFKSSKGEAPERAFALIDNVRPIVKRKPLVIEQQQQQQQ